MIITITNPDGSIVCPVLIDNPAYDEYIDKPRRLTAKIEKHSGLNPQGVARADHEGKIILLGHIKSFDQSKKEYDTLLTTRTTMLERPLKKIKELSGQQEVSIEETPALSEQQSFE